MKVRRLVLTVVGILLPSAAAIAFMTYTEHGVWPEDWPDELDALRDKACTYEGPIVTEVHEIPFETREEFEAAWPHLLASNPRNAQKAIHLVSGPSQWSSLNGKPVDAGVRIIENPGPAHGGGKFVALTLIVDGNIVDLNRIPLPMDTPIFDDRFPPVEFPVQEEVFQGRTR